MTTVNIVWRRSGYDKQVHAFSLAQIASGRSYLEAICEHTAPPAVLEPVLRPGADACRVCSCSATGSPMPAVTRAAPAPRPPR